MRTEYLAPLHEGAHYEHVAFDRARGVETDAAIGAPVLGESVGRKTRRFFEPVAICDRFEDSTSTGVSRNMILVTFGRSFDNQRCD